MLKKRMIFAAVLLLLTLLVIIVLNFLYSPASPLMYGDVGALRQVVPGWDGIWPDGYMSWGELIQEHNFVLCVHASGTNDAAPQSPVFQNNLRLTEDFFARVRRGVPAMLRFVEYYGDSSGGESCYIWDLTYEPGTGFFDTTGREYNPDRQSEAEAWDERSSAEPAGCSYLRVIDSGISSEGYRRVEVLMPGDYYAVSGARIWISEEEVESLTSDKLLRTVARQRDSYA